MLDETRHLDRLVIQPVQKSGYRNGPQNNDSCVFLHQTRPLGGTVVAHIIIIITVYKFKFKFILIYLNSIIAVVAVQNGLILIVKIISKLRVILTAVFVERNFK